MKRFTSSEDADMVLSCFFNEIEKIHAESRFSEERRADELKMSMAGMCAILHNIKRELRLDFCKEMVEFLEKSENLFEQTKPQRVTEYKEKLGFMAKDIIEKMGKGATSEEIENELAKRIEESGLPFDVKVMSLEHKHISVSNGKPDLDTLDIHGLRKMMADAEQSKNAVKKYKKGDE